MKKITSIEELNGGEIVAEINTELIEAERRLNQGHPRAKIVVSIILKADPENEGQFFVCPSYDTTASKRSGDKCTMVLRSGKIHQDKRQMKLEYKADEENVHAIK